MLPSRNLTPVVLMGSLGIAYVLARPVLEARFPYLGIIEFPLGAVIVAFLVWWALPRVKDDVAKAVWKRHKQVVRTVSDPALRTDLVTLERWLETGEDASGAADVFARAAKSGELERAQIESRLTEQFSSPTSRRKRESILQDQLDQGA